MFHLRLPSPCLGKGSTERHRYRLLRLYCPKSTDFSKQALARLNRPVTSSLKKSLRIYAYFPSLPKRFAQIH